LLDRHRRPARRTVDGAGLAQGLQLVVADASRAHGELTARGVKFEDAISDYGYGLVTHFRMPGDVLVELYQPKYEKG